MKQVTKVYLQLEEILEYARGEWARDRDLGLRRKESYWQGKKDGVRVAMNLLYQIMSEEELEERLKYTGDLL